MSTPWEDALAGLQKARRMYFARMNSSFSDLEAFSCNLVFTLASHIELASELPPLLSRAARFAWGQQSKERLLTLLM